MGAVYPHFIQLILVAAKPVNGLRGRRGLRRKCPPTVDTEKELHMEPTVPTEDMDAVSKLSSAAGEEGAPCSYSPHVRIKSETVHDH